MVVIVGVTLFFALDGADRWITASCGIDFTGTGTGVSNLEVMNG
jgi:hypothetical protein